MVTLIHDSAGQFRYGLAMIQEATAWKLEEAIRAGEKQALELLAQNANLEEALGAFLDALQGADPEMQCAILLADADGRYLRHVAAFHMPDEYYLFADCLEVSPTNGSCGAAAYRRERVIVEDTVTDPLWAPYREHIESSGLRAGWLQPIISAEGTLLGTFGLYYGEPRRPTSIEIQLLEEAASVAGIIIERKRSAEMLKRHQLELAYVGRVSLVGELASGLAHELHQPLAAIVNYAGACVRRVDSGNIDQAAQLMYPIEQMRTLALRAGDIVRGLRTLIQSGNLRHERVDLNELITTATHLAQPEARHYGITLRLDLGSTLPGVEVYAIQIEQVILNLVNNGIEAMSANGRSSDELIVRSYVEPGTDGVMIAVRDGGHGLPDDPEKVFVPFFTTKRNGLGMGLAISRSIVETQGGRLWAEPNVEGGSTFLLKLPAASAPLTHPAGNGTARHTRTAS
jgi:signal transduction histidine kinase